MSSNEPLSITDTTDIGGIELSANWDVPELPDLVGSDAPSIYQPISKDQIRVLTLHPAAGQEEPLVGNIKTFDSTDRQAYNALSYAWGDPSTVGSVQIEGRHVRIARNLDSTLRYLRSVDSTITLWVDAISMNMDDMTERGHQILKLNSIFGDAERVIAWLGEETTECQGALHFLAKVVDAPYTDDVLRGSNAATYWAKVRALLQRPYFARVWVVQEIAIARHATAQLGDTSMDWRTFDAAVTVFQKRLDLYLDELHGSSEASWRPHRDSSVFCRSSFAGTSWATSLLLLYYLSVLCSISPMHSLPTRVTKFTPCLPLLQTLIRNIPRSLQTIAKQPKTYLLSSTDIVCTLQVLSTPFFDHGASNGPEHPCILGTSRG